jgi:hypothetical protein
MCGQNELPACYPIYWRSTILLIRSVAAALRATNGNGIVGDTGFGRIAEYTQRVEFSKISSLSLILVSATQKKHFLLTSFLLRMQSKQVQTTSTNYIPNIIDELNLLTSLMSLEF